MKILVKKDVKKEIENYYIYTTKCIFFDGTIIETLMLNMFIWNLKKIHKQILEFYANNLVVDSYCFKVLRYRVENFKIFKEQCRENTS